MKWIGRPKTLPQAPQRRRCIESAWKFEHKLFIRGGSSLTLHFRASRVLSSLELSARFCALFNFMENSNQLFLNENAPKIFFAAPLFPAAGFPRHLGRTYVYSRPPVCRSLFLHADFCTQGWAREEEMWVLFPYDIFRVEWAQRRDW